MVPSVTGGGCSSQYTSGNVTFNACISASFDPPLDGQWDILSDAYVSFRGGRSWSSCAVNAEDLISDGPDAGNYFYSTYNCLNVARANRSNVHFGPTLWASPAGSGDTVETIVWISGSTSTPVIDSPANHF